MGALILSIPLMCGAMLFWLMIAWNAYAQGMGIIPQIDWRHWTGGTGITVLALLAVTAGWFLLHRREYSAA
jgi:hypothetical protein